MRLIDDLQVVLEKLPEDRLREVLHYARYLAESREGEEWRAFGMQQFARAYGPDEPEYLESDILRDAQ